MIAILAKMEAALLINAKQLPPSDIMVREVMAKREMLGAPWFVGFAMNDDLLELRGELSPKKTNGIRSWNLKNGKANWFVPHVALPSNTPKLSTDGSILVIDNIDPAKDSADGVGFRVLRTADGKEIYATNRERVSAFAFASKGFDFVTYGSPDYQFQFWKLDIKEEDIIRGEFVKRPLGRLYESPPLQWRI